MGAILRIVGRALWYGVLFSILGLVFFVNGWILSFVARPVAPHAPLLGYALEAALVLVGLSPPGQAVSAWLAGLRPLTTRQRAYLLDALADVRVATGYRGRVVLHIIHTPSVNACALGTRHVAVTEGWFWLPRGEQDAILAHELGHLSGRHSLLTGSLSLMSTAGNWVGTLAVWIGFGLILGGARTRRRGRGNAAVGVAAALVAAATLLMSLVVWAMWSVYCRQSEYEADAYAARHGYRTALASALARIGPTRYTGRSVTNAIWASHPATWRRLRRLARVVPPAKGRAPALQRPL